MNGITHPVGRSFPRCPECGGKVQLMAQKGRTREFLRNVHLPIPDTFEIPTCVDCGKELMVPEIAAELDKLLAHRMKHGMNGGPAFAYLGHGYGAVSKGRQPPRVWYFRIVYRVLTFEAFDHAPWKWAISLLRNSGGQALTFGKFAVILWSTECNEPYPKDPERRCYGNAGHEGDHCARKRSSTDGLTDHTWSTE